MFVFFFNDTATTEIYTLSLHDALPIYGIGIVVMPRAQSCSAAPHQWLTGGASLRRNFPTICIHMCSVGDRKSTRLNSSHLVISYAVFCLKKKNRHLLALLHNSYDCGTY